MTMMLYYRGVPLNCELPEARGEPVYQWGFVANFSNPRDIPQQWQRMFGLPRQDVTPVVPETRWGDSVAFLVQKAEPGNLCPFRLRSYRADSVTTMGETPFDPDVYRIRFVATHENAVLLTADVKLADVLVWERAIADEGRPDALKAAMLLYADWCEERDWMVRANELRGVGV